MAGQAPASGRGFRADQCALQAANKASRSAKWRYTVRRVTPASSATAAIEEWAGPTVVWRRTAASVMRVRVSSTCSARRRMRYGRDLIERICSLDIDIRSVGVHCTTLFTR